MAHFYLRDDLEPADAGVGSTVELSGDEGRHAVTVSRLRVGESVAIGNGRGLVVSGEITSTGPRQLSIVVERMTVSEPRRPEIALAQALAKGDRDERAVQAATELGVDEIIPWSASRSVSRWDGPKAERGRERWSTIVREASKQSLRPVVPTVRAITSTRELERLAGERRVLVLDPEADVALSALDLDERDLVLVVGPEGGVSDSELASLAAAGAEAVRLGPEVLRTSTAGPAALALVNARLGRW
ncbi:16S rRNA (uracil(1498)-N(3))-methyltransferase [Agromyces atrinae]|uniref:16S rRNA (uracil(1498)-N(3))-methyltransferase n=1 Tax=Agromyces atrinae TaxID=592376 RepID=UPI001F58F9F6|nr:16S rRNA (uracil(1498)-N(3))-methyltransferase [Agromyces atrinae]MCI2958779.1 16S rRNA (uracil(1498)-N(3))-methyltransferase [Agromyces atrinae]